MDYEKLHKDTIAKLQEMVNSGKITVEIARGICADFVPESEDEKIRKALIEAIRNNYTLTGYINHIPTKDILAWLEKQGEQKTVDEIAKEVCKNKESAMAFLKSTGIINEKGELAEQYRQSEQKPTNEVKPKFKIGDRVIGVVSGMLYFITEVCYDHYNTESGCIIMFCAQDNFDLVEQKPAEWSEEDEYYLNSCITKIEIDIQNWEGHGKTMIDVDKEIISWLKSLKERVQPQKTWKPSDEQITWLYRAADDASKDSRMKQILNELLSDLKKLKG